MKRISAALVTLLLLFLFPHLWWPGFRSPFAPGHGRASPDRPVSAAQAQDQFYLAEMAVREPKAAIRRATAEKVKDPLARLFMTRLEEAAEQLKNFNPNEKLTAEIVQNVRQGLPKEIEPVRSEVMNLGPTTVATLNSQEKQALEATSPALRIDAVRQVANQEILAKVALDDIDPNVRKAAVDRLTVQGALAEVAMCEWKNESVNSSRITDTVRHSAVSRLTLTRQDDPILLSRVATRGRSETMRSVARGRLKGIRHVAELEAARERLKMNFRDPGTLAQTAISHANPAVRHGAVDEIVDQATLLRVAEEASDWGIRRAAVAKITDEALRRTRTERLATNEARPGQEMTVDLGNSSSVIQLLWVPPTPSSGFVMGSPADESSGEWPHSVILTKGLWLGRTEVTQAQWEAMMFGDLEYLKALFAVDPTPERRAALARFHENHFTGPDLPTENLVWEAAMEFCQRLTQRERAAGRLPAGYEFTLPTEAQWEYACRAGAALPPRASGKSDSRELDATAWYLNNARDITHPVGTRRPNAWGFCDMQGNVWEWCRDWVGPYPRETVSDPQGPPSAERQAMSTEHIARGGDWRCNSWECRIGNRHYGINPGKRDLTIGFRVALAPVSSP